MGPDWLDSPQHFAAGAALAAAIVIAARLGGLRIWLAVALAIGAVSTVEIIVEVAEYPWLYSDGGSGAYYDTVADLAGTIVGAAAGAAAGLLVSRARRGRQYRSLE
jgi:hypothetical protein